MPIFEYVCKDCNRKFETIVYGSTKPECPHCRSRKLEQQLSVFAVGASTGASAGSHAAPSPCGSCGDPRGPGACSLGDLD